MDLIEDELKYPEKYKPIARGPWVALCLMMVLGSMVPFWLGYHAVKTWLSTDREKH